MKTSRVMDFESDVIVIIHVLEENSSKEVVFFDCPDFPNMLGYSPKIFEGLYQVSNNDYYSNDGYYRVECWYDGENKNLFKYVLSMKKEFVNSININQREHAVRKMIRTHTGV